MAGLYQNYIPDVFVGENDETLGKHPGSGSCRRRVRTHTLQAEPFNPPRERERRGKPTTAQKLKRTEGSNGSSPTPTPKKAQKTPREKPEREGRRTGKRGVNCMSGNHRINFQMLHVFEAQTRAGRRSWIEKCRSRWTGNELYCGIGWPLEVVRTQFSIPLVTLQRRHKKKVELSKLPTKRAPFQGREALI